MNIIVFASALHDIASVLERREEALRSYAGEEITLYGYDADLSGVENPVCFIATGGTEELFERVWEKLPRPVVLLSDGYHNSLAAAFEIASFLEQKGVEHRLINLPLEGDGQEAAQVREYSEAQVSESPYGNPAVMEALSKSRIGLIGGASSWLISSGIDPAGVAARFGAEFIDINIRELEEEYRATAPAPAQDAAATYSREALADAERMYRALKAVCLKYRLTALTIKCFDLLESCRTTSCLALARLSDEGIISGCEGDIPSLWSLIVAHALTGRPAFMANPSSSNPAAATVDFAHCTIPISMTSSYTLPSHFESGIGIGIAGILPEGPCKILKIGGPLLDKVFRAEGSIVCNTRIAERCRTQIRFQFPSKASFDRFMANRLGNHIVLFR